MVNIVIYNNDGVCFTDASCAVWRSCIIEKTLEYKREGGAQGALGPQFWFGARPETKI